MDDIPIISIVAAIAAIASAAFAWNANIISTRLSRRNLRLEVHDLNTALNERVLIVHKVHQIRRDNLDSTFELAGSTRSGRKERYVKEWEEDAARIEKAGKRLEPSKRTFEDLDDHQLEGKLIELKSIERLFELEYTLGKEWEAIRDRSYLQVRDTQNSYR